MTEWAHGLFGCLDDCAVCLLTYFVPCYIVGKNAEAVDDSCIMHCLAFYIPLLNWYCIANVRGKIRDRNGIEGTFANDCLLTLFCPLCVLTQMYNVSAFDYIDIECIMTLNGFIQ